MNNVYQAKNNIRVLNKLHCVWDFQNKLLKITYNQFYLIITTLYGFFDYIPFLID